MTTNTRGVSEAMPEAFAEYVAKNYSGEVVFSNPRWHAERLWRAARYAATLRHAPALADMAKRMEAAERDSKRLDFMEREHCTVRVEATCDDDVFYEVVDYYMAEPQERVIGSGATPRDAIDAAIAATQEGEG